MTCIPQAHRLTERRSNDRKWTEGGGGCRGSGEAGRRRAWHRSPGKADLTDPRREPPPPHVGDGHTRWRGPGGGAELALSSPLETQNGTARQVCRVTKAAAAPFRGVYPAATSPHGLSGPGASRLDVRWPKARAESNVHRRAHAVNPNSGMKRHELPTDRRDNADEPRNTGAE